MTSDQENKRTEQTSGSWVGKLRGMSVRDPGPDADGPILELHGEQGMAAVEIADESIVDNVPDAPLDEWNYRGLTYNQEAGALPICRGCSNEVQNRDLR